MRKTFNRALIASFLALTSFSIEAAGFREIEVPDAGYKSLTVGLWYPSNQAPPDAANTQFGLPVALGAPISAPNGGLILISHGFGGWYAGHADTAAALADAGFMVAAPSHSGNTWSDMSSGIDQWAVDRPRHISRVIDHLLADSELASHIDSSNIGFYGFSAGGYTGLGLIGGVPDIDTAVQFCQKRPSEFVCKNGMIDALYEADMQKLPDSAWGADERISAAVLSAPGLAFAYTAKSLSSVTADVQLWSGELDDSVPTQSNAALLAQRLPKAPETHWIANASHFAFMVVACREAFKLDDPIEYEMVCGDPDGFDRIAFHTDMHEHMIRFYEASFKSIK